MNRMMTRLCPLCGRVHECSSLAPDDGHAGWPQQVETATLQRAVEQLRLAKSTLVCGLGGLSIEAQFEAWKLADQMRAVVADRWSRAGGGITAAIQRQGVATATLGEWRQRVDCLLIWRVPEEQLHPCLEAARIHPESPPLIIRIEDGPTPEWNEDDGWRLQLPVGMARQLLRLLRMRSHGLAPTIDQIARSGLQPEQFQRLFERLGNATYGGVLMGESESLPELDDDSEQLVLLVRDLNRVTRFVGAELPDIGLQQSPGPVLTACSGVPFGVNLTRGYPRSLGSAYTGEALWQRQAFDSLLLFTSEEVGEVPEDIVSSVPSVVIGPRPAGAGLYLPAAQLGDDAGGHFRRSDGVTLTFAAQRDSLREDPVTVIRHLARHWSALN